MKKIELTRGMFALVDDEDFGIVSGVLWNAHNTRGRWCATRSIYRKGRHPLTEWMHLRILPPKPGLVVDHINGDALDNRKENLRYAPAWGNGANGKKRKFKRGATSTYKGVCWNRQARAWRAEIRSRQKLIFLGHFDDEREAALRYDRAARECFGEFARPNFT